MGQKHKFLPAPLTRFGVISGLKKLNKLKIIKRENCVASHENVDFDLHECFPGKSGLAFYLSSEYVSMGWCKLLCKYSICFLTTSWARRHVAANCRRDDAPRVKSREFSSSLLHRVRTILPKLIALFLVTFLSRLIIKLKSYRHNT